MLIQTDKDGRSLYSVMYFKSKTELGEFKLHAKGLDEARALAKRFHGLKGRKVISVGLTVGGFEDSNGIHI